MRARWAGWLAMGVVSFAALAATASSDDWASYLELPPVRADPGNAWERWSEAGAAIDYSDDAVLDEWSTAVSAATDTPPLDPSIEAVLEKNAAHVAAFCLRDGEFVQLPRLRGPGAFVDMAPIRRLARLTSAQVRWLWLAQRRNEATQAACSFVESASALLAGGGDIAAYLNTIAVNRLANEAVLWLAERPDADAGTSSRLAATVRDETGDPIAAFRHAARVEYQLVFREVVSRLPATDDLDELLASISVLAEPGVNIQLRERPLGRSPVPPLDVEQTLREYGEPLAAFLQSLGPVWREGLWEAPHVERSRAWQAQARTLVMHLTRYEGGGVSDQTRSAILAEIAELENPVGRMLILMLTPAYERLAEAAYRQLADAQMVRQAVEARVSQLRSVAAPADGA